MDKKRNSSSKTLEVIWKRNSSARNPKSLPELKEINIDDSVKKVKKSPKHNNIIQNKNKNENCSHKPVKRSLFHENKNKNFVELFNLKNLNKKSRESCSTETNLRKNSDGISVASELHILKSQKFLSSRERLKKRQDALVNTCKQHLIQTDNAKTVEISQTLNDPSIIQSSYVKVQIDPESFKSPEIVSNQRLYSEYNVDETSKSNYGKLVKSNLFNLKSPEIVSNRKRCTKRNNVDKTSESNYGEFEKSNLCSFKSPEIVSNRKRYKEHNVDETSESNHGELVKSNLFILKSPEIVSNRKRCTERNNVDKTSESDYGEFEKSNLGGFKSPEIVSNRKRYTEHSNVDETSESDYGELVKSNLFNLKSPEIVSNRKLCTERNNVDKTSESNYGEFEKSNLYSFKSPEIVSSRKLYTEHNVEKTSESNYGELVKSNLCRFKSPEIVSNRKRCTERNNADKTSESNYGEFEKSKSYKSPEIVSNRKRYTKHNNVDKMSDSNYGEFNENHECKILTSKKLNEKSEDLNTHLSKFQSNTKSSDSDDIIESSETFPSKKQKSKKRKVRFDEFDKIDNLDKTSEPNFCEFNGNHECKILASKKLNEKFEDLNTHLSKFQSNTSSDSDDIIELSETFPSKKQKSKKPKVRFDEFDKIDNLDKIDVSNYDKFDGNYKHTTSKKLNKKSKNLKMHSKEVQSSSNSICLQDIVESPEIIFKLNKQKSKKRKKDEKRSRNKNIFNQNQMPDFKSVLIQNDELKLQINELNENTGITITKKNEPCDEIKPEPSHIINSECILNSPVIEFKCKHVRKKPKISPMESHENTNYDVAEVLKNNNGDKQNCCDTSLLPPYLHSKNLIKESVTEDVKRIKTYREKHLYQNKDKNMSFYQHSSEINEIPATPEHDVAITDDLAVKYFPKSHVNTSVPLIEVDQSPKTPLKKNHPVLIQSEQTPLNVGGTDLIGLFEPVASPTQSFIDSKLPFKIDSVESPGAFNKDDNFSSPERCKKQLDLSLSPNSFDSAKKRKKVCKDGLRGKFRDLINRKKSEACIREYEKNLSKIYQPKLGETVSLNIIEAWKEFSTSILLCYYIKDDSEIQRVLVTLDNCPKNATKNSVIRIYSPWLTIESKITELLLFVGVIHAEVIEFGGSIRSLGPTGLFTKVKGLQSSLFENEVLWKCNCSEDVTCQCLGELSVYNYLQYMVSH